jgi:DNA modification methylase
LFNQLAYFSNGTVGTYMVSFLTEVESIFKTIYFPRERCKSGKAVRVTMSFPTAPNGAAISEQFLAYIQTLSSKDFRQAIGDPFLEDLESQSQEAQKSLGAICLDLLLENFGKFSSPQTPHNGHLRQLEVPSQATDNRPQQLELLSITPVHMQAIPPEEVEGDLGVTFRHSRQQPVHRWYPYVEGFSATYVRDALLRSSTLPRTVYDPFGGSGTTQFVASCLGIKSFYSEINPFMAFIAEVKVRSAAWAHQNLVLVENAASSYLRHLTPEELGERGNHIDLTAYNNAFPDRDFFEEPHLRQLLAARDLATEMGEGLPHVQSLFLLACAAIAVDSSNMTRRADLRRRRPGEYKDRVVDVAAFIKKSLSQIIEDIKHLPSRMVETIKVSADCRQIPSDFTNSFDLAITSPPYLNGTNYFRNTKIELWLLGFMENEEQLVQFHRQAIAAGINSVTRSSYVNEEDREFEEVEVIARKLDECARDKRIPALIRQYFSDMERVLASVYRSLVPGGRFLLDIGDSRFYGVHVPTDQLLLEVARIVGFEIEHRHTLARRHSRDKSELTQVELIFRKPRGLPHVRRIEETETAPGREIQAQTEHANQTLENKIQDFARSLPYKHAPYNGKSWGHGLHSLCSYQGKLKPGVAHWLVREFVPEGGSVLDPLGGVGTVPFEAALSGRIAVSNDKSPFASLVAAAKLSPPTLEEAERALQDIERCMREVTLDAIDQEAATFGLNATVADYYHPETLHEVLAARKVFLRDGWGDRGKTFLWASLLHILHGNRPYALSRTSHPITPFYPSGPAQYKNVVQKIRERMERALGEQLPETFRSGTGLFGDFRDLPTKVTGTFDAIITSPPFLGMRFDRPNWLRLWFCGWEADDFHNTSLDFLERQQTKSRDCYLDFFSVCQTLLRPSGILVIHLGSGGRGDLVGDFKQLAEGTFQLISEVRENVEAVEQHGLQDKGRTTTHHFLFFHRI